VLNECLEAQTLAFTRQLAKQGVAMKNAMAQNTTTLSAGIQETLTSTRTNRDLLADLSRDQQRLSEHLGDVLSDSMAKQGEDLKLALRTAFNSSVQTGRAIGTQGGGVGQRPWQHPCPH
jgi:hypothetical protein